MAVLTMAKKEMPEKKETGKSGEAAADSNRESSLKVYHTEQQLIAKIAAHRNLSVKELFREKDFQTFLRHILLAEITREAERLKD